MLNFPAY